MPGKPQVDLRYKGKTVLQQAVREQGFTHAQSIRAVDAVLDSWKGALARHEDVELPVGVLQVLKGRARKRVFWPGRLKNSKRALFDLFRQPNTVRIVKKKGLD
jgi:hypothetical protein